MPQGFNNDVQRSATSLKGSVPFFQTGSGFFGLDIARVTASIQLRLPTSGVRKKQFVMQWTLKAAV